MRESQVRFHWLDRAVTNRFGAGVSLHSHTLHSRECLSFIARATGKVPYLAGAIQRHREEYKASHDGRDIDMARAWWTPPLSPRQALSLEQSQIEIDLGLDSLVSLTDHDTIDGCQVSPFSVEWTVPFRQTFFHIGIHNMPPMAASRWMKTMNEFTARPIESKLAGVFAAWNENPETLVVWNHPMWDEKGIGAGKHWSLAREFFARFGRFLHAMELNGLRPWRENRNVVSFARVVGLPVISGGDRHAQEPNACINLTNARTFAEFTDEVRRDGWSDVLFLAQYRDPLKLRIIQNICGVMRENPDHAEGWRRWSDRVFYRCDDGVVRSLTELWSRKVPGCVRYFVSLIKMAEERWAQSALRFALAEKDEPAL